MDIRVEFYSPSIVQVSKLPKANPTTKKSGSGHKLNAKLMIVA